MWSCQLSQIDNKCILHIIWYVFFKYIVTHSIKIVILFDVTTNQVSYIIAYKFSWHDESKIKLNLISDLYTDSDVLFFTTPFIHSKWVMKHWLYGYIQWFGKIVYRCAKYTYNGKYSTHTHRYHKENKNKINFVTFLLLLLFLFYTVTQRSDFIYNNVGCV